MTRPTSSTIAYAQELRFTGASEAPFSRRGEEDMTIVWSQSGPEKMGGRKMSKEKKEEKKRSVEVKELYISH